MRSRPWKIRSHVEHVGKSYFRMGRSHQLFVLEDSNYSFGPEYLSLIESFPFPVLVKMILKPVGEQNESSIIGRYIADRKSEIRFNRNMGDSQRELIEMQIRQLENIAARIGAKASSLVNTFTTFRISTNHPVHLSESSRNFSSLMGLIGLKVAVVTHMTSRKLKKVFSIFDSPGGAYLMDTMAASSIAPLHFSRLPSAGGVPIGVDDLTEKPIFLDVFGKSSHNIMVFGETGSGKSFFSKLLLMRSVVSNYTKNIVVVDPLDEYSCSMFPDSCTEVSVGDVYSRGTNHVEQLNWQFETEIVIFKINSVVEKNSSESIESVLSRIYGFMISDSERRKIILIDEAHLVLSNRKSLEIMSRMIRHSRHYNASVISVTQNLDDLSGSQLSSVISENSSSLFIFRTRGISKSEKARFGLSGFDGIDAEILMGGKNSPYSECYFLEDKRMRKVRVLGSRFESDTIYGKD